MAEAVDLARSTSGKQPRGSPCWRVLHEQLWHVAHRVAGACELVSAVFGMLRRGPSGNKAARGLAESRSTLAALQTCANVSEAPKVCLFPCMQGRKPLYRSQQPTSPRWCPPQTWPPAP